jgi:hypothetical protein
MSLSYTVTSHETFSHDSLDSLGYDWERIANPYIEPKYPLKVYIPQTTEDIIAVVKEVKFLKQKLTVRSKGHSSNDLVLAEKGSVLCTEKLNRILEFDADEMIVCVQSGIVLAELDAYLTPKGFGLPIIGDHNHITAGGFASVGGISPGSHRFGLFIDNIKRLEYVNWNGEVVACGRDTNREDFYRLLAGMGQFGVIATLTLDIIPINKDREILKNKRFLTRDVDKFIDFSYLLITNPGDALMERGVWLDLPAFGTNIKVGQFSSYYQANPGFFNSLRNRAAYGYMHALGRIAGRLPKVIDELVKYLGMLGVIFSPKYASVRNIESFTDKILDSTVGDPTRMLIVLAPAEHYQNLFRQLYELMLEYRKQYKCFTFISFYVKAINSEYLNQGDENRSYSELMMYLGVNPKEMTGELLNEVVSRIDDLTIEYGALRYMHTKTVKDAERRQKVDPNAYYARGESAESNSL